MSNQPIFDLFCEDERQFTPHKVVEAEGLQTITCLTCGHVRVDAMIRRTGINVNLNNKIFEEATKWKKMR